MSCTGKQCGFNIYVVEETKTTEEKGEENLVADESDLTKEHAGCSQGNGSCFEARILSAQRSGFHDDQLIAVTEQMQKLLKGVAPDPAGRKLSFINTNMGLLLAWVEHGTTIPPDAVTDQNTDEEIAAALKLETPRSISAQGETAA